MKLKLKLERLKKIISKYKSCLIAFSGGVDSTFLLKVATLILPKNKILVVTADSLIFSKEELLFSKKIAKDLKIKQQIIRTSELEDKRFISNPVNRCYFCKKALFRRLKIIAKQNKLNVVVDASNASDNSDFRPGNIAKKELNILSPLAQAGFSKDEIRKLSKKLGLSTWDKPSLACLASRVTYGMSITRELLKRINQAETYLKKMGFRQVRVRHYNGLCRIEVLKKDIPALINIRKQVINRLSKIGYNYVTVDLEGYRTGSMNEEILCRRK